MVCWCATLNEVIMFYNFSVVKSQVFLHRMMSRGGHALFFSWCAIAILFALFTVPEIHILSIALSLI